MEFLVEGLGSFLGFKLQRQGRCTGVFNLLRSVLKTHVGAYTGTHPYKEEGINKLNLTSKKVYAEAQSILIGFWGAGWGFNTVGVYSPHKNSGKPTNVS